MTPERQASAGQVATTPAEVAPLVSFVIPTHNYGRYIRAAVESALAQTYHAFELIVVDDGSTDDTRDVLEPLQGRLRYVRQQQGGPSAARNAGLRLARGEFIAFLDADDVWLPHKTALQVSYLLAHPQVGLVCSRVGALGQHDGTAPAHSHLPNASSGIWMLPAGAAFAELFLHHRNHIPTSTVMLRRECIERVGGFDESLRWVEDFNLWLRVGRHFGIARLPETLALHRYHEANLAASREAMRKAVLVNLDRICALYPEVARLRGRVASQLLSKHGLQDLFERRLGRARANLTAAIRQDVLNAPAYPLLLASCCPAFVLDGVRVVARAGKRLAGRDGSIARSRLRPTPTAAKCCGSPRATAGTTQAYRS